MTRLIAIFGVLVLLGCLHIQLARNPMGAISSPDPPTHGRVGKHRAQPRTPDRVGTRVCQICAPRGPGGAAGTAPYQNR